MGPRRSWREFRALAVRYVAVLVLVAVGVAVVVGLGSAAVAGLDAIDRGARQGRLADGEFTTISPLSAAQVEGIRSLGVHLEDAATLDLPVRSAADERAVTARLFAVPATLNRPVVSVGRLPASRGEALVDVTHARATGLRVGSVLAVEGAPLTVVGLGSWPNYAYPLVRPGDAVGDAAGFAPVVVTPDEFAARAASHPTRVAPTYAFELRGVRLGVLRDHLLGLPVDADAARNGLLADALRRAAASGVEVAYPNLDTWLPAADNPRVTTARDDATMNVQVTGLGGVLVMLVVGYVLAAFSVDRIDRESTTMGALLALGFTPGELLRAALVLPVGVTVAGSAVGLVGGLAWAPRMTSLIEDYYSAPPIDLTPDVAVLAVALLGPGAIVGLVNAVLVSRHLTRTPLELLRPVPDGAAGGGVRLPRWGFTVVFRMRQALRSWASYALIVAGVGLATVLLVFGFGMDATITGFVGRAGDDLRHEHTYALRFPDVSAVPAGAHAATAVPMRAVAGGETAGDVVVLGISAGETYFPADVAGLGPFELVLTDSVASKYDLRVGDLFVLRDEADLNRAFTVAGVVPYASGMFAFTTRAHAQDLLPTGVVELAAFLAGGDLGEGLPPGEYYNMLLSERPLDLDPDRVATHTTRASALAGIRSFTDIMGPTIAAIMGPAIALFVVVLYVLIHTAIGRQRYAISLLKAFGYTEREVARLYLANYAVVVAVAVAAGLVGGMWLMGPLWRWLTAHVSFGAPFVLPAPTVGVIVALAVAAYATVRLAAARDTRKVSVVDVLKFRE